MNFWFLATKSVSELTSTSTPTVPSSLSGQQAGGGLAALALGQGLQALQADDLESLLGVAVSLGQSLLDVHHAGAGLLTQRLHICSGEIRHRMIPLSKKFSPAWWPTLRQGSAAAASSA